MIPLLIDTDVARGVRHQGRLRDMDDGCAIMEAMNAPELELSGVTVVRCSFEHTRQVAGTGAHVRAMENKGTAVSRHFGGPALACDAALPGNRVCYRTSFAPGGAEAFLQDMVDGVY